MALTRFCIISFLLSILWTVVAAQTVAVDPVVSTEPTAGNADDPAIWIHPTQPERSVIIGTDKDAGIYVYNMDGDEIQHIEQGTNTNNVDVRYDINLAGETVDIVAANLRDTGKLAVFKVNPNYSNGNVLTQISDKNSSDNDIQKDSYGFTLYKRKTDGALFVFDRPKSGGKVRQYRVTDDGTSNGIIVTAVRDLNYSGGTAEGYCADDQLGFVYITEESKGIHKFYADPNQSSDRVLFFADGDGIKSDREGLGLYTCADGTGYLVLSSQGNSTVKIYERQGDNKFVKTVETHDEGGKSGLGSDGVDVTSFAAGPNFPNGFLIAHDESGARYHLYDWAEVAESDMTICVNNRDGDTPKTTSVSGDVRNSVTNDPVSGAVVQLQNGSSVIYETTSGGSGQFSFNNIDADSYQLVCTISGFNPFSTDIAISEGQSLTGQRISLVPSADTTPPAPPENVTVTISE